MSPVDGVWWELGDEIRGDGANAKVARRDSSVARTELSSFSYTASSMIN